MLPCHEHIVHNDWPLIALNQASTLIDNTFLKNTLNNAGLKYCQYEMKTSNKLKLTLNAKTWVETLL